VLEVGRIAEEEALDPIAHVDGHFVEHMFREDQWDRRKTQLLEDHG